MLTSSPMFVNLVFNSLVEYLDSKPILNLSVKEFLWGYDDRLVKMASNVLPSWINFAKFGLLDRVIIVVTNHFCSVIRPVAVYTDAQSTSVRLSGTSADGGRVRSILSILGVHNCVARYNFTGDCFLPTKESMNISTGISKTIPAIRCHY